MCCCGGTRQWAWVGLFLHSFLAVSFIVVDIALASGYNFAGCTDNVDQIGRVVSISLETYVQVRAPLHAGVIVTVAVLFAYVWPRNFYGVDPCDFLGLSSMIGFVFTTGLFAWSIVGMILVWGELALCRSLVVYFSFSFGVSFILVVLDACIAIPYAFNGNLLPRP
jgi:hypothetical protein